MDTGHSHSSLVHQGQAVCPLTRRYTAGGITRTSRAAPLSCTWNPL